MKKNLSKNSILITTIIILGVLAYNLYPYLSDSFSGNKLDLKDCVEELKSENASRDLINYTCAMREAKAIYATDPSQALDICVKYHFLGATNEHDKQRRRSECKIALEILSNE